MYVVAVTGFVVVMVHSLTLVNNINIHKKILWNNIVYVALKVVKMVE